MNLSVLSKATFRFSLLFLLSSIPLMAQAPAGAPAGANGVCKDGTYSTAAKKDGACRGHKGVQTWYTATTPSLPPPVPSTVKSQPVPSPAASTRSLPVPQPGTTGVQPPPAAVPSMPSRPAPVTASSTPSRPVPAPSATTPSLPAPQPGSAGSGSTIASESARLKAGPAAPGGGPGLVWVNTASKVYHCPGSDFYGKTKTGAYMPESDAKAQGARPNRNKPCS